MITNRSFKEIQRHFCEIVAIHQYCEELYNHRELERQYQAYSLIYFSLRINYVRQITRIIGKKDKFHLLKPINQIMSDKQLRSTLSKDQQNLIKEKTKRIENLLSSQIRKSIKIIRDQYISHNEFPNTLQEKITVKQVHEFVLSLLENFNDITNILGFGIVSTTVKDKKNILKLINKLESN